MIDGAIILLYHRVTILDRDPQLLSVSPENFKSQIEWLSNQYRVIPLEEIASALAHGQPLNDAVVITFDDGYADNLHEAAPILQSFDCPATVFATTGLTNTNREFFWDDLDRIFLAPGTLPRTFALLNIDLGDSTEYDGRFADWTVLDSEDPTPRHATYRRLTSLLHSSTVSERQDILDHLQAWSSVPARQTHRMMTTLELQEFYPLHRYSGGGLGRGLSSAVVEERTPSPPRGTGGGSRVAASLITLGGHTVDHCRLSAESLGVQSSQIQLNRAALGYPTAFSYPFGTRHDYTDATVQLVKQAGYGLACANFGGTVTSDSDRYRLPRRIVRDCPIDQFIAGFNRWITPRGAAL